MTDGLCAGSKCILNPIDRRKGRENYALSDARQRLAILFISLLALINLLQLHFGRPAFLPGRQHSLDPPQVGLELPAHGLYVYEKPSINPLSNPYTHIYIRKRDAPQARKPINPQSNNTHKYIYTYTKKNTHRRREPPDHVLPRDPALGGRLLGVGLHVP